MSLAMYDRALSKRLKDIFPNFVHASSDEVFAQASQNNPEGKIGFPLISAWRTASPPNIQEIGNQPEMFTGRGKGLSEDKGAVKRLRSIPINITYQIDIWAKERNHVDDIYREVLDTFTVRPEIFVEITGIDDVQAFEMFLVDYQDNTNISQFTSMGRLYRTTLTYQIPHARMFYLETIKVVHSIPVEYFPYVKKP